MPTQWIDGVQTHPAISNQSIFANAWDYRALHLAFRRDLGFASRWIAPNTIVHQCPRWPYASILQDFTIAPQGIMNTRGWWGNARRRRGSRRLFAIIGVTRDEFNSVVSNATVWLFRSTILGNGAELLGTTVSDENGNYQLNTPYDTADHIVLMYRETPAPPIQGATRPNLTGV